MIYSGVDLIRQAENTQARVERLQGPSPVAAAQSEEREPDQQGALMRFARFLHKEKRKKPVSKPSAHPYAQAFAKARQSEDVGQILNAYI